MGQAKVGADDAAELAGAGGGVARGAPAAGEDGEATFAAAAHGA
jgi:hypothetical protein